MPWTPKQMSLFRAIAHGWHMPGGGGPSQSQAKKMVTEGTRAPVRGDRNVQGKPKRKLVARALRDL